jgi:hypothetical protein
MSVDSSSAPKGCWQARLPCMNEAQTDAFQSLNAQLRDLERRYLAVAPAKAAMFAFACTDTSAASRGLVHADATVRDALNAIRRMHPEKVSHVPAVIDSIGVLYEYYLTWEAAVATQIADPTHLAAALAEAAIIAPDVDDALRAITHSLHLHQDVAHRWFVSLPPATILLVCLIYVVFIVAPIAELKLPPELQALLTNEASYVALAITIAGAVIERNRRK